jgi:hypothetical protein
LNWLGLTAELREEKKRRDQRDGKLEKRQKNIREITIGMKVRC